MLYGFIGREVKEPRLTLTTLGVLRVDPQCLETWHQQLGNNFTWFTDGNASENSLAENSENQSSNEVDSKGSDNSMDAAITAALIILACALVLLGVLLVARHYYYKYKDKKDRSHNLVPSREALQKTF